MALYTNDLGPPGEEGLNPAKYGSADAMSRQFGQEPLVRDQIECLFEIE